MAINSILIIGTVVVAFMSILSKGTMKIASFYFVLQLLLSFLYYFNNADFFACINIIIAIFTFISVILMNLNFQNSSMCSQVYLKSKKKVMFSAIISIFLFITLVFFFYNNRDFFSITYEQLNVDRDKLFIEMYKNHSFSIFIIITGIFATVVSSIFMFERIVKEK